MNGIYQWFNSLFGNNYGDDVDGSTKVMFWVLLVAALAVLYGIYRILYSLIDSTTSKYETWHGEVIDKMHSPSTLSTGVGFGPTTNGGVATVITTSGHDEEWGLIVREHTTKNVLQVETSMQEAYDIKIGEKVKISAQIGGLSKSTLSLSLANN